MHRVVAALLVFAFAWVLAFREGLDVWSALAALIVSAGAVLLVTGQSRRGAAGATAESNRRGPTRV